MSSRCTTCRCITGVLAGLVLVAGHLIISRSISAQQFFQVDEAQLVGWVFNNQQSLADARSHLETRLAGQLEFVAVIGNLQPEQRRRLELAGQGDIARYIADAEALIARLPRGNLNEEQWNELWQQLAPIRERYARGISGRNSLFEKALRTTLSEEQLGTYVALARERARRHYRALVGLAVADIEVKIPLTSDQRTRLIDALMAHTRPPRGQLDQYLQIAYVLHQMSKVPPEQLQPIFDDREWKCLQGMMDQMRGWAGNFRHAEPAEDGKEDLFVY